MYSLESPIETIDGIGPKLLEKFAEKEIRTFKDLLLFLPLRYSDRSEIIQIKDLEIGKLVSFSAQVSAVKSFYKNRRKIDSATATDTTGKVKLMWFNNKFISQTIQPNTTYMISGKLNDRGVIVQPTVEKIVETTAQQINKTIEDTTIEANQAQTNPNQIETIHTGRLVPIYSSTLNIQQGTLRRILKKALTKYQLSERDSFDTTDILLPHAQDVLPMKTVLTQLHFPDSEESIIKARERLALEELLALIKTSEQIKTYWKNLQSAEKITLSEPEIPDSIPFVLTAAQKKCVSEILADITTAVPMNRVLIGDVGSGKTVVAGIAGYHTIKSGKSVAFVAPTKILAEQHYQTLQSIFPDIEIELLTGKTTKTSSKKNGDAKKSTKKTLEQSHVTPKLYIGTHALINKIDTIKPGLIIYDEQHRFGVTQRSESAKLNSIPHTLTMSATPIPRSLMLTIFSHLKVSMIDELPKGRIPTKTWVVPEEKRTGAYDWIAKELCDKTLANDQLPKTQQAKKSKNTNSAKLALIVCPFIDPSNQEAFENVANVTETFKTISTEFAQLSKKLGTTFSVGLLHGRMKPAEQNKIITDLYDKKIDILVTTPIVEVGVDLPAASIIVIEASERFGMASLHQLRGRVGRAGQQGYCLLFSDSKSKNAKKRLENFSKETNGLKLAELDLQSRGSGDIFGTEQSGLSNLKYASWTNLELIGQAKQMYEKLPKTWQPFFTPTIDPKIIKPLAN